MPHAKNNTPVSNWAHAVTVLWTEPPHTATKKWTWNADKKRFNKSISAKCYRFTGAEYSVGSLNDLAALVERQRSDPRAVVLRGALTPAVRAQVAADPNHRFLRRCDLKKHGPNGVTLLDVARHWVMIDIDNWIMRPGDDLNLNPDAAIRDAIEHLLPTAFHDAMCFWQLSSSAGFSGNVLKAHLWFWLSAPATGNQLKTSLRRYIKSIKGGSGKQGIDGAMFSPAQYHFTADPIIDGGHDPVQRRTGWLHGLDDAVTLPPPPPPAPPIVLPVGTKRPRPARRSVESALRTLGDGPDGEGFHGPLLDATMRYAVRCVRHNDRCDEAIKATLRERMRSVPANPGRDADIARYSSDYYLDGIINGAFARIAGQEDGPFSMPPLYPPPAGTVDEARGALDAAIREFLERAGDWHVLMAHEDDAKPLNPRLPSPEHAACGDAVGTGKSTAMAKHLPHFIARNRDNGLPDRVFIGVTTHKLGRQTIDKFDPDGEADGGDGRAIVAELNRFYSALAAPWIGRKSLIPGTDPALKLTMCKDIPAVEIAQSIHADVETAVCGSGKDGAPCCPFRKPGPQQCGWAAQIDPAMEADIVVGAHQAIWHELPRAIRKNLGLVVLDENWTSSGIYDPQEIVVESLVREALNQPIPGQKPPKPGPVKTRSHAYGTHRRVVPAPHPDPANPEGNGPLIEATTKLWRAASRLANCEPISQTTLRAEALTAEQCQDCVALTWRRMRDGGLIPGMAQAERIEAAKQAAGNRVIPRLARMWKTLADFMAGDEEHCGSLQAIDTTTPGGLVRHLILRGHREITPLITGLPTLTLTATLRWHIQQMRAFLPRLTVLTEANPHAPYQRIIQVVIGSGKSSRVPDLDVDAQPPMPENAEAKQDNARIRRRNVAIADFLAFHGGMNSAVITFMDAEPQYKVLPNGEIRQGLLTNHFNETVGLDRLKHVTVLGVVGRTLPDAETIRELAIAVTGRDLPVQASHTETRGVLMEDGSGVGLTVRVFADPDLEAARAAIADAAVVQDGGRGRGVNRTARDPLTVFVFADVILPYPVHQIVRWEDIEPTPAERMMGRGYLFSNPDSARIAHADIFPHRDGSPGSLRAATDAAGEAAKKGQPWTVAPQSRLTLQPAEDMNALVEVGRENGAGCNPQVEEHMEGFNQKVRGCTSAPKSNIFLGGDVQPPRFGDTLPEHINASVENGKAVLVRFQLVQKGKKPEAVFVWPHLVAGVREHLTALLGPLAYCVVVPAHTAAPETKPAPPAIVVPALQPAAIDRPVVLHFVGHGIMDIVFDGGSNERAELTWLDACGRAEDPPPWGGRA